MSDPPRPGRGGYDPRRLLTSGSGGGWPTPLQLAGAAVFGVVVMALIEGNIMIQVSRPQDQAPPSAPARSSPPMAPAPAAAAASVPAAVPAVPPAAVPSAAPEGASPPPTIAGVKPVAEPYGETRDARLIFGPGPAYPPLARQARVSGAVSVELLVDEEGRVIEAEADRRANPILAAAAVAAVREWRYTPALNRGQPVRARITATISFKLDDR